MAITLRLAANYFIDFTKKNIDFIVKTSILGQRHLFRNITFVYFSKNQSLLLSESASGFQSVIPLSLVVEWFANQGDTQFIIEEPELNLYPITQKGLVYYLADRCTKGENELLMTTHSLYILAALNNLLLPTKPPKSIPKKPMKLLRLFLANRG